MKKHLQIIHKIYLLKKFALFLILLFLWTGSSWGQSTVTIGSGTATSYGLPIETNYAYTYSQQIYTQAQIGATGTIEKIRFYYSSGSTTNSDAWRIYMGHTTKTSFSSTNDWVDYENLTRVYNSNVTFPESAGWMEITLSTPFAYNNIDNLVIAVDENTSGYSASNSYWGSFSSGANTGMYYRSDTYNPNPSAPPISASFRTSNINQIQLDFAAAGGVVDPTAFTAIPVAADEIDLGWTKNENGDDVMVAWNTANTFGEPSGSYSIGASIDGGGTVIYNGSGTAYNHTGLTESTTYYYKAWSVDGTTTYSEGVNADATTVADGYLAESFESTTFPPTGWANPGGWSRSTSEHYVGDASAYKYSAATENLLRTPIVTLTGTSTLDFDARTGSSNASQRIQVQYSSDAVNWTDIGAENSLPSDGTWSPFSVDLSSLAGNNYYLALAVYTVGSGGSVYLDHVIGPMLTIEIEPTGNPRQVSSLGNLLWISANNSSWGDDFIQTADIDAAETSSLNDGAGFSPIGNSSTQLFTGSYDGQDYEISNLYISRTTPYNGLFGYAGGGATFSSIHLIDLNYSNSDADFDYVGGLVGYVESTTASTITNCTSTGEIFGDRGLGGLIGGIKNLAVISDCSSDVDVSGTGSNHGGFVGSVVSSSTTYYVSFSNCSASGNVSTSEGTAIGGFGGWFEGDCSSCYASGNVTNTNSGYTRTGGFLGVLNSYSSGSFTPSIENCYCTGNVHAKGSSGSYMGVGGFIGQDFNSTSSGNITNCYSVGTVTAPNLSSSYVGGFIGDSQSGSTITACFWNSNTTDQSVGIGRISDPVELHKSTTAAMKTESTYTDENWDFTITPIWAIKSGTTTSYPYLAANAQIPAPGEGATWTGAVSSNWSISGNWNGNIVPTLSNNAIIPSGLGTYPIISSSTGANCNNLTVENGASLTINSGASLITNGTITNNGTINVEQDIDGGAWHFIAAPVSGAVSEIYDGNYLQKWSEIEQKWLDITTLTEPLTAAKGFSLWYDAKTPGTTFTFSGTPFTGDQSIDLYYDGSKGDPDGHIGTNLVGNPYPSYIDWNELSAYGSKYTWNGTGYDVYMPAGDYGEGSQYVAPMEGFFVVAESSGSFDLDNTVRTHNSAKKEASAISNAIVLSAQSESYSDALYIVFDENAGENFEQLRDAWKFISGTRGICQLWTECSDGILAVDVRPQTESIQLGFANNEAGTYSIAIKEIADISTAILEDTKLNIFHNLSDGAYSFDWVLTDDETRFKLHCNTTAVEDISLPEIQVYVAAGNIIIKSQTTAQRIILTDITGRTLGVWESVESIPAPKTAGVYLVSIESDGQRITEKLIVE